MYCRSFNSAGRYHANNPNLTSSMHDHQKLPSSSTDSSFHKNNFLGLLSKSNHLTNFGLSSEEVLATPLPCFFHHSPSLSRIPPSISPLFLLAGSCRSIMTSCRKHQDILYDDLQWLVLRSICGKNIQEDRKRPLLASQAI